MNRIAPPDQREREKIFYDLDTNFLIEAGAGSGKTSSLVKRMVAEVETGKFKISEIAAVTFTRKAAAELKERFQTKLEEVFRETTDPEKAKLLEEALMDMEQCFLGTIHSFCARLLRERPIEAGLDPNFKDLTELQEKLLQEQAWESYLLEVKLNQQHRLNQLSKLGLKALDLKDSFINLATYPDVDLVYEETIKPDFTEVFQELVELVERAVHSIPKQEPDRGYDKLQKAILKTVRYLRFFDLNQEANIVKILANFEKELSITQNRWNDTAAAKQYRDEFSDLTKGMIFPLMEQWREYCHYYIVDFLQGAVQAYEKLRQELSFLNFQDLLMKTGEMLRNHPEVRVYFQNKYRCLLVDEFQDTDPIQAEIMFYLTGSDPEEKDWQKLIPTPGSLFVVGDPKQSIYRFRRADIDTYNLVKDLILASDGEVLKLTANFRSLQALGSWFNPVFRKLMPEQPTLHQAEFSPMHTMRENEAETGMGVKVLETPATFSKKEEVVRADAEAIAKYIKWALEGNLRLNRMPEEVEAGLSQNPRAKDFMIIVRYKDLMNEYAKALEEYGIPVNMTGGSSLREAQELKELFKLLKFLQDPSDQVGLIAVLRGLYFGLSDECLYRYKTAGGYFNIFNKLPEKLDEVSAKLLGEAFGKLQEYYRWSNHNLPTVTLEKIIGDLGLVPYTLAESMAKSRCSYIFQILELLRKAEIEGATSFNLMVEQFGVILEANVEEELSLLPEEDDAVRIMNLHKAKGLEAPVVFLAHPAKSTSPRVEQHIKRVGQIPKGYFSFSRSNGQFSSEIIGQPQDWVKYQEEEAKYLAAEEARLIYVAATRAKNMLVLSRSLKDKEMKKNPWSPLFMDLPEDNVLNTVEIGKELKPAGKIEITKEVFAQAKAEMRAWREELAVPSYNLKSPTGLKQEGEQVIVKRQAGGGAAWGTLIHKVMEELVKGNSDLDTVIQVSLTEVGLAEELKADAKKIVSEFKASGLWSELEAAQLKLTEVPFSLKISQSDPLYASLVQNTQGPVLLSGYMDLVYKGPGGWVIVDYKTDRVEDLEDLKKLYGLQVSLYCQVWEQLTGEKVQTGEIWSINQRGINKVSVYTG